MVLRCDRPVLACFGTRDCPGRRALAPGLARVAAAYEGRLVVVSALLDRQPLLAEQLGIAASPTLMVFQHGDRQARAIGFLPAGLLQLLADEAASGALSGDTLWSPVEERFEDVVLIPLLERWGLAFERQAPCALPGRNSGQRGRVDLLVYDRPQGRALTLIESKRQISGEDDLQRAAAQASAYAHSLALPSFVVAAPRGLWFYRRDEGDHRCVARLSGLELHETPERARRLLVYPGGGDKPSPAPGPPGSAQ